MIRNILLVLFTAALLSGCGKPAPKEETQPTQSPLALLYQDAQEMANEDNADGAITLLEGALSKDEFTADRSNIFSMMLSFFLQQQKYDEAVTRHIAMASESAATAEPACSMIEQALIQANNYQLLLDWSMALLEMPLGESSKSQLYITQAYALAKSDRTDEALALIPACRNTMSEPMCANIYRGMINSYLRLDKINTAYAALDKMEGVAGESTALLELITVSRLDLYSMESKWDSFILLFAEKLKDLTDAGLVSTINTGLSRMSKDGKDDLAQQICALVIDKRNYAERSFRIAAQRWLTLGAATNPEGAPEKIRLLMDKGFTGDQLLRMTTTPFYKIIEIEKFEALKKMMALIKEIQPSLTDTRDITTARSMLLDGSFTLNDYDTAIEMISQGIEGRDENWHKSAMAKLKAHKALDAGNTDDAVKYFREFMTVIKETMDSESDPVSGMVYTSSWCLGRNAKRIGDIYKEAGDESKSSAAYKEAIAHFKNALQEVKAESREHAAITKEMAAVPAS